MPPDLKAYERVAYLAAEGNYLKQHPQELGWAFHHAMAHCGIVNTVVEIGAMGGASFYVYAGLLARGGKAIAVDTGGRGQRDRRRLQRIIARLWEEGIDAYWLRGNSHEADTREKLLELLGGKDIDFLHIDGDHSAEGSYKDYADYGSMVRPGGMIAMHDIRSAAPCHVDDTWERICNKGSLTRTLCAGAFKVVPDGKIHRPCGIGLIYV